MTRRRGRGEVLALILSLAARPEGVTTADIIQRLGCQTNSPILPNAAKAGHVFKADRKRKPVHWFATQEAADAWVASCPAPAPKKPRGRPAKLATEPKPAAVKPKMGAKKPHIPKPAEHQKPPTYTAGASKTAQRISGEPIITEKTRRVEAKTPLSRFHVPDDFRGPFSLAGIGRDVQTGQAWGA
jgi:hypothetical protein